MTTSQRIQKWPPKNGDFISRRPSFSSPFTNKIVWLFISLSREINLSSSRSAEWASSRCIATPACNPLNARPVPSCPVPSHPVPSRISPLILHTQAESGAYSLSATASIYIIVATINTATRAVLNECNNCFLFIGRGASSPSNLWGIYIGTVLRVLEGSMLFMTGKWLFSLFS